MKDHQLKSMSVDQLWELHEAVVVQLTNKIVAERAMLEARLRKLSSKTVAANEMKQERRCYPKVLPKYRNPDNRSETWAGRGKQPRWVKAQLRTGKKLDDLLIRNLVA
jgi:DNA-binding protein H-NS